MLGAAPAQATGQPGLVGQPVTSAYADQGRTTSDGRSGWWRRPSAVVRKDQDNEASELAYLCDVHAILALDHLLIGRNEENAKCAKSSFNDN
jgi:hypothetical protein